MNGDNDVDYHFFPAGMLPRTITFCAPLRLCIRRIATDNSKVSIFGKDYHRDETTNVTKAIIDKLDRRLHLLPNHPVNILKIKIEKYLLQKHPYKILDSMNPVVTTQQNFDELLIGEDHPGRNPTDTYYVNKDLLLRTHTSAHQSEALRSGSATGYLLSADVYRRDEIDPTHYPVFHQMEGIRVFSKTELEEMERKYANSDHRIEELHKEGSNPVQPVHSISNSKSCAMHLRLELEGLMRHLFAPDIQIRWIEAYFPFTSPRYNQITIVGRWRYSITVNG
jgi:phenylalanyl-tRNA synthetase alpha chain